MPRVFASAVGVVVLGFASVAAAQTPAAPGAPPAPAPTRPSEAEPPPSCLDRSIADELSQSLVRRGVQKKTFLKAGRFQLAAEGGLYASDLLSTSYMVGGALSFWATEDLAVELMVHATPVALELDEPVADFFGDPRFERGQGFLALGSLVWSPIHFKVKTEGDSILHGDASLVLGGGRMLHETAQGLAFDAGLILELYLFKYMSLRFDFRDIVLVQEAVAETRLTNNLTAVLGVSFWFPAVY